MWPSKPYIIINIIIINSFIQTSSLIEIENLKDTYTNTHIQKLRQTAT